MAPTPPPPRESAPEPIDDYLLDRDAGRPAIPASTRVLQVLNGLLLLVLVAVSLGLFFLVATLIGIT